MHANKDTQKFLNGIKMKEEEEMCDGERYEERSGRVSGEGPF